MQSRFRIFPRQGGVFYIEDTATKKQHSLRTRDRAQAEQLLHARLMAVQQPILNRALARTFLAAPDEKMLKRIWSEVFAQFAGRGRKSSQERTRRAAASADFNPIRNKPLIETTADDFLAVLKSGSAATSNYLRRFHNLALDLGWLLAPVLPKKVWPRVEHAEKRAITPAE